MSDEAVRVHRFSKFENAEEIHPFGTPARVMLRSEDTGGDLSALLVMHGPGEGPPPHFHTGQSEYFFVVEGRYEMTVAGETRALEPGDMAFVPPDTIHSFRNITDAPSKMLDWSLPGGQDHYFREIDQMGKGGRGFDEDMMQRLAETNARHDAHFVKQKP
ncbi:MAG: cupin domain-containing protein [Rhodospirillaceae bacterium]|jgi:mannose-6-phosphate isomerase-like protein (cupin superfamily)|nr:cupin domain-containing protein [Rhodospirillaceae bacterium]MBT4907043.1 cupin domain-containing protein [Rhodospirillaceae bacterium]MBT5945955.1 cupin domain-containing protein [Rhodospirillaceae bacterium]MBT6404527.1 cupin domain-containing protein [Rhodospirillaceae bacterium]MBT6535728.1 cupin domain-containing protein [Rhodospirillaceae bacterium]